MNVDLASRIISAITSQMDIDMKKRSLLKGWVRVGLSQQGA